ncbi:MAG TPA: phosphoribosylaminoimidazolesuccinocarboxamide synthase [Lentisphaeria bacterium]|nr:MAG: phosphoribosylaminoimidazolesuccinocarboxamide synthase [Lentisphaerae bacterium GWF2_50_93]HCE43118.1 phosphoribosylaminoimidazolesuccinocarboxamide synthase [Lentisphaeria bacterium]
MKYDRNKALLETDMDGIPPPKRGKVRDIYDLGDSLLFVATDRISAFDVVMPNGIPDKGRVLTGLSLFWFDLMEWMPNHLITADVSKYPDKLKKYSKDLKGRSMLVKKAKPLAVECIVRGYITGSGWKDYQKTGTVCGIPLRKGYYQAEKLDEALFTPSTKAEMGTHDENISFEQSKEIVGAKFAEKAKHYSIKVYNTAANYAATKGIILADTKFEFGAINDELILIDEVLTPDSSRFWPADQYKIGGNPPSLDKQFVRDYLETLSWAKTPPAPDLPDDIVSKTHEKYLDAYKRITGKSL